MNLVPDYSLVLQILTFLVLWIFLKRLLFDPVLRVLAEREERTVGARKKADAFMAIVERDREEYEHSVYAARAQLAQEAAAARKVAQDEAAQLIGAQRDAVAEELTRLRATIASQVEQARRSLAAEAASIAAEMLARVSGRVLG
jgi:F-type H+-transporting ATPase subunit b